MSKNKKTKKQMRLKQKRKVARVKKQVEKKRAKVRLDIVEAGKRRTCGQCQACCEVMRVKEIEKSGFKKCEHQCTVGCSIYNDRPSSCQEFSCSWLDGVFDEEARPDKLGVMFYTDNGTRVQEGLLIATEIKPNQFERKDVDDLLTWLSTHVPVYMMWYDDSRRRLLFPESKKAEIQDLLENATLV
jgi:hypothetical protein